MFRDQKEFGCHKYHGSHGCHDCVAEQSVYSRAASATPSLLAQCVSCLLIIPKKFQHYSSRVAWTDATVCGQP